MEKIADRDDIDLLIITTPWEMHTEMCLYGMEKVKHVASEVPIGYTLEYCWKLVQTAERTQKHCMMMETSIQQMVYGQLVNIWILAEEVLLIMWFL